MAVLLWPPFSFFGIAVIDIASPQTPSNPSLSRLGELDSLSIKLISPPPVPPSQFCGKVSYVNALFSWALPFHPPLQLVTENAMSPLNCRFFLHFILSFACFFRRGNGALFPLPLPLPKASDLTKSSSFLFRCSLEAIADFSPAFSFS